MSSKKAKKLIQESMNFIKWIRNKIEVITET
jgi:hypothetical protein